MRKARTVLLLLPLLLSDCFTYKEVEFKGITDVRVQRMDAQGVALRVGTSLRNPNGFRIRVLDPDVSVYLNDVYIGKAVLDTSLALARHSDLTYLVPMHATFDGHGEQALGAMVAAALTGKAKLKAKGSVVGKAFLFSKRFPFEQEQTFDLKDQ